jgi:hypothetical protein
MNLIEIIRDHNYRRCFFSLFLFDYLFGPLFAPHLLSKYPIAVITFICAPVNPALATALRVLQHALFVGHAGI